MRTSCFDVHRKKNFANPVSIARYSPSGFKGVKYEPLMPDKEALSRFKRGDISQAEFILFYNSKLDQLNPASVILDLGKDAVLLCYESARQFCHRRLVAQWIADKLFIEIPEV